MKVLIALFVFGSVMVRGCQDNMYERQTLPIANGTYEGTFTLITPNGSSTGNTSIVIDGNLFVATGNANRIPAGGSGTFSISRDYQSISFYDENFWTADFDWSLILSGKFIYSFDGEKLEFSRQLGDGSIVQRYQLTKK